MVEPCATSSTCDLFTGSVFCSLAAWAANSAGFTLSRGSLNRETRALWRAPVFDKFLKFLNGFIDERKSWSVMKGQLLCRHNVLRI